MLTPILSTRHPPRLPTVPLHTRAALVCFDWLHALVRQWQRTLEAAENRRALHALDDRTLKDVGLDRSDIESWIHCGAADRLPR